MKYNLPTHAGWWLLAATFFVSPAFADPLKPFILAQTPSTDLDTAATQAREALKNSGFEIAGEYSPYPQAKVIVVTNDALKTTAAQTENGGFGAAQRVAVTQTGQGIQVSYANPAYTAAAFRMSGDLGGVADKLSSALGNSRAFGAKKELTDKKLRKYHYMIAMPYFDDVDKLASFESHAAAVQHIEKQLDAGVAGTQKVYRIDIPGKDETVFGVGLKNGEGADATVMSATDTGDDKHTAHLPYQILVSGPTAIALRGKFRIAASFPDLSMGTFMKIANAPGAIKKVLTKVAGN